MGEVKENKEYRLNMVLDVLGEDYSVLILSPEEDHRLRECDGFTDKTSHRIVISDEYKYGNLDCPGAYLLKILRHEIIHAFMYESGLGECWEHVSQGQEETVVDWFAIQWPKLHTAFSAVMDTLLEQTYRDAHNDE